MHDILLQPGLLRRAVSNSWEGRGLGILRVLCSVLTQCEVRRLSEVRFLNMREVMDRVKLAGLSSRE